MVTSSETLSLRIPPAEAERVRDAVHFERTTLNEFGRQALAAAVARGERRHGTPYPPRGEAARQLPRGRRVKARAEGAGKNETGR